MTSKGRAARPSVALPDLVIPVKPTDDGCTELRYALRSVAAHAEGLYRKVWIIGVGLPEWLTNVGIIEAQAVGRAGDVRAKITAAANDKRVAARFVLMSDDTFLVEPITEWRAYHMGPFSEYLVRLANLPAPRTRANSSWVRTICATADWMTEQGHGDTLTRQGHRPVMWDKKKLAAALAAYPTDRALDVVGLYDLAGAGVEGGRAKNTKITVADDFLARLAERDSPWVSSNERSFREGMVGGYIRGMFRDPSPYEREV